MFELHGLNGASIFVNPATIYRIRRAVVGEDPAACEVQYGASYVLSTETAGDIVSRLGQKPKMIAVTARDGSLVWLNKDLIGAVRPALPINAPGTEITISGHYQHVIESVEEVLALMV